MIGRCAARPTALLLLALGCTVGVHGTYAHPVVLESAEPVPAAVALDLASLRAGELPGRDGVSDEVRKLIGSGLAENAERVARAAFEDVSTTNDPAAPRAVLRPRVARYVVGAGGFGFAASLFTLVFEWSVLDTSGELVWIETVTYTGTTARATVHRVMRASHAALVGSRELRAFAAATP